jgi:hypothetical protein
LRKVVDDADLEEVKTSRLAPHIVERATGTSYLAADKAVSINRSIQPHGMGVAQNKCTRLIHLTLITVRDGGLRGDPVADHEGYRDTVLIKAAARLATAVLDTTRETP